MRLKTLKTTGLLLSGVLLLFLSGCVSNASVGGMVYTYQGHASVNSQKLVHNIGVSTVRGGHESNPLWTSQIDNTGFRKALEISLDKSKLYKNLSKARYALSADLLRLDQPFIGFDLKVTAEVHYKLINKKTKKVIFDKDITSNYTAAFSDSPIAAIRLKIANEGAARMSIKQLIHDLYSLRI